ncbi:mCG1037068, partial [Mus musculus]
LTAMNKMCGQEHSVRPTVTHYNFDVKVLHSYKENKAGRNNFKLKKKESKAEETVKEPEAWLLALPLQHSADSHLP